MSTSRDRGRGVGRRQEVAVNKQEDRKGQDRTRKHKKAQQYEV
jgi:hypothetical protein